MLGDLNFPSCATKSAWRAIGFHFPVIYQTSYTAHLSTCIPAASLVPHTISPVNGSDRDAVSIPISITPTSAPLIAASLFIAIHPLDKSIGPRVTAPASPLSPSLSTSLFPTFSLYICVPIYLSISPFQHLLCFVKPNFSESNGPSDLSAC